MIRSKRRPSFRNGKSGKMKCIAGLISGLHGKSRKGLTGQQANFFVVVCLMPNCNFAVMGCMVPFF